MKSTIVGILISNSIDYLLEAHVANEKNRPDEEVRYSIGAQLMIALVIEGIANEIGEIVFGSEQWRKKERCDTVTKWNLLSSANNKQPFNLGEEPLQTVKRVATIRDQIAHPKVKERGNYIIFRTKKGELIRNPSSDYIIKNRDSISVGYNELLNEFNYQTSLVILKKSVSAITKLREHLSINGLDWVDNIDKILNKKTKICIRRDSKRKLLHTTF
jgi:hypothetical protein